MALDFLRRVDPRLPILLGCLILGLPRDAMAQNSSVRLIPYYEGQFGNSRYAVHVEDTDRVSDFQATAAGGTVLVTGSTDCSASASAAESAIVTITASDFPVSYVVHDCSGNVGTGTFACPTRLCFPGAVDLITNGSFEADPVPNLSGAAIEPGSSVIAPWVVSDAPVSAMGDNYFAAADGGSSLALSWGLGLGSISQLVTTTPGRTYKLLFDFAPLPWDSQSNSVTVDWNGSQIDTLSAQAHPPFDGPPNWSHHEYLVTAAASSSTLEFRDVGASYPLIDDVRLLDFDVQFSGFYEPISNLPVVNRVKSGSAVPVKFSLGGNKGLTVFMGGYPRSQLIQCDTGAPLETVSETVSAGQSGLTYDAGADRYNYVWKTDKTWSGSCRELQLRFIDGSLHVADFNFAK